MVAPPVLRDPPSPAYRGDGACKKGCYTNKQLHRMLDQALDWIQHATDKFRALQRLNRGEK